MLCKQIALLQADVVCLQEVERKLWEDMFGAMVQEEGYGVVMQDPKRSKKDHPVALVVLVSLASCRQDPSFVTSCWCVFLSLLVFMHLSLLDLNLFGLCRARCFLCVVCSLVEVSLHLFTSSSSL